MRILCDTGIKIKDAHLPDDCFSNTTSYDVAICERVNSYIDFIYIRVAASYTFYIFAITFCKIISIGVDLFHT